MVDARSSVDRWRRRADYVSTRCQRSSVGGNPYRTRDRRVGVEQVARHRYAAHADLRGRKDRFAVPESLRTNVDDCFPLASLGRVEGGDGVVEVYELRRAEVERRLTVGRASGADDVRTGLACELRHHRPNCAGCAVREEALPRLKAAVFEQSLPRGQARDWQTRADGEVDVA